MLLRALAVWLLLLVIAVGAGALREGLLVPRIGDAAAHVVGTVLVVALFVVAIGLSVEWIVPSLATGSLVRVGVGWTVLTVAFELALGRLVMGLPWNELLREYDVLAGRVWILVPLTTLLVPWILGRLRAGG